MVGCFQGDIRVKNMSTPAFKKKKHGTFPFQVIFKKKKLLNSKLHTFEAKKKLLKNVPVTSIIYVCFSGSFDNSSTHLRLLSQLINSSYFQATICGLGGSHGLHLVALQNQGQILGLFQHLQWVPTTNKTEETGTKQTSQKNMCPNIVVVVVVFVTFVLVFFVAYICLSFCKVGEVSFCWPLFFLNFCVAPISG